MQVLLLRANDLGFSAEWGQMGGYLNRARWRLTPRLGTDKFHEFSCAGATSQFGLSGLGPARARDQVTCIIGGGRPAE